MPPNTQAAANGGGPSRLQSARLVAAVGELGSFGRANLHVQQERQVFIRVIRGHSRILFCPRITPITRMPEPIDAGVPRGPEAEPGCSSERTGCVVVPCWMPLAARH